MRHNWRARHPILETRQTSQDWKISSETREADQYIEAIEELDQWEAAYERQGE